MHLLEVVYMTFSLTYSHSSPMKRSLLFVLRNRELKASTARISHCISSSARIWTGVIWLLSPLVLSVLYCSSRSSLFNQRPFTTSFTLFLGKNSFLVAEWPWAAYLISLCFSLFIIKGDNNGTCLGFIDQSITEWISHMYRALSQGDWERGGTSRHRETEPDTGVSRSQDGALQCLCIRLYLT